MEYIKSNATTELPKEAFAPVLPAMAGRMERARSRVLGAGHVRGRMLYSILSNVL
jgi:hypothetical protein